MLELSDEDISVLIKEIKRMGKYRHIIIDCNFDPGSRLNTFSKFAYKIVFCFRWYKAGNQENVRVKWGITYYGK